MNQHETKQTGAALRLSVYMILIAALLLPASGTTAQAAPVQQVSAAAVGTTYTVTSTSCTGPGSITEAMAKANANPGTDTITFTPGLQIDAGQCLPGFSGSGLDYFMVQATESVTFDGKGAKLVGQISWISDGGLDTPLDQCPTGDSTTITTALTPGFIKVGLFEQNNEDITVTVRNLDMQELNSVARIEKNASLILEDLSMYRIISAYRNCNDTAVTAAEGANFTARRTRWESIWHLKQVRIIAFGYAAAISSYNLELAGDLTIEDSYFSQVFRAGTINWWGKPGSVVNIVTSRFDNANGFIIQASAKTNIVNTIWSELPFSGGEIETRLANGSTEPMNIVASTFLYAHTGCDSDCQFYGSQGRIYRLPGAAKINLVQSAIGVNFPDLGPGFVHEKLLDPNSVDPPYGFSADEYTWVQPTAGQDADALKIDTNQLNLLTDPPAFRQAGPGTTQAEWATPLDPGELIDRVPDAACGQANQLLNPIDNTCITVDALGNPRVDANGKRNIGAVQLALAPYLTVTGTGDGTVDLSWTKPQFSAPATGITGYQVHYRETGAMSWETPIDISGPDTLTYQVTSLTNGTEYELEVRATYSPDGEGPYSNTAKATPFGPIGTPVVTATPGNGQVDLSWSRPSDGGHVIYAYNIVWRPTGTTYWIGATTTYSTAGNPPATQTTITGLTNGTEYEFAVTAIAVDGELSPQSFATATPGFPGMVRISKYTAPGGGTGFSFTQDIDNSGDFTLDDQGHKNFTSVAPGTYTVTETDPQGLGYEVSKVSCFEIPLNSGAPSTGDPATRTATINMDAGEYVQCVFVNMEEHSVVIEKRTIPPGGSGFTFSDNIGTPNNFSLDDAEIRTFTHVQSGDYQVIEAEMPGYELTAIDCLIGTGDLASRTANISLIPGEREHCTFTNTKLGTLILRKETLPDGAPDAFGYTISGPNTNDSGTLTDGGSTQVDNAKSGTWALTESLPAADWHLGDISCTSTLGTSTFTKEIDNLKATVELAPGDTMDCTFTNVEDETITVEKVTIPAGDTTTDFAFTGSGSIGVFDLMDGESQSFSVDPNAGPFTLTEGDPSGAGYGVTEIRCVNTQTGAVTLGDVGARSVLLNTQPGESQHCTFTNERHGQVVIRKATAPAGDTTSSFDFYGSFGSFSLKDGEDQTIVDVTPGAYSVSEVDPSGLDYRLSGLTCTDSDPNGTPSTGDLVTHSASINVDAGETVECTFTNAENDTVLVQKFTDPADGTGFNFTSTFSPPNDSFSLDDLGIQTVTGVAAGQTYIVTEADPTPAYDLTEALCFDTATGATIPGDLTSRSVTFTPAAGHVIYCEFLNQERGTVIIEKAPGSGTGYGFSGDLGDFTLDSGKEQTFVELKVGAYSVTEQTPPGDTLTGLTCTDSDANGVPSTGEVASSTATINLDPGETVRCTFTNQPGGSIVIKKAVASGPTGPFTFLDNIQTPATFELSDGGEQRFDGVLPGTYTVQETALPDGSGLAQITCVDSDANGTPSGRDPNAATAVIHLDPGETVECTFTNEDRRGQVIIRKGTAPAGGVGFAFSGNLGDFTLDDGDSETIVDLLPGTYKVTENDPLGLGYELSGLSCADSNPNGGPSSGDIGTRTATIQLDEKETVTCIFTNTEDDTVTVEKLTVPPSADNFGFGGDFGAFNLVAGNVKDFTNVTPGNYSISEDDPTPGGYALTDISCVDSATGQTFPGNLNSRSVALDLVSGERVHCTFTNTKLGTVIIKKATAPGGGSGFSFSGSFGDFTLDDGTGKTVINLIPGSYTVTENDPLGLGYELSGLTCSDSVSSGQPSTGDVSTRTASVNLDPGETVTCTFTNSEDDTVTVEKVTIPPSSEPFGFDGSFGAFKLLGGEVKGFTELAPGEYLISEDLPTATGYLLTSIRCVDSATNQVFLGDVSTRSVKLKLVAGETVHCTFVNELPTPPVPNPNSVRLYLPIIQTTDGRYYLPIIGR